MRVLDAERGSELPAGASIRRRDPSGDIRREIGEDAVMLETARDQGYPCLHQISFFLPNKVGSLKRAMQELSEAEVRICGISILDAHDHAVVRMIVDQPAKAEQALTDRGRAVCSARMLGVALSDDAGTALSAMLGALLRIEINVYYVYTLLSRHRGCPVTALHADDVDTAARVLRNAGFTIVSQRDFETD